MESAGFGNAQFPGAVSRGVALAVALLAVALPVGGAHLWLIFRSLRDPAERSAGVRHQYLNLWVTFALLVVVFTGQTALGGLVEEARADVTIQASILIVAAAVGAIAAWWISRTPPGSEQPRVRSAIVVMLVAVAVAAFSAGNAASTAGGAFPLPHAPPDFFSPDFYPPPFPEPTPPPRYPPVRPGLAVSVLAV